MIATQCETDTSDNEVLYVAATGTIHIAGASLELGVRKGGSSEVIMQAALDAKRSRSHIGVDPWGNLEYKMGESVYLDYYPDVMRRQTFADLYTWVHGASTAVHPLDLLLFAMKDVDFFRAFADGVPFYTEGKFAPITMYSFIFFDAEHTPESVLAEVEWCAPRTSVEGQWVFDDVSAYDHRIVHNQLGALGFDHLPDNGSQNKYVYIKRRQTAETTPAI